MNIQAREMIFAELNRRGNEMGLKSDGLSRRELLQNAGWMIGLSALATPVYGFSHPGSSYQESSGAANSPGSSVMSDLSGYMSHAGDNPLPAEALEKTKQHTLDTLAAMVSGVEL